MKRNNQPNRVTNQAARRAPSQPAAPAASSGRQLLFSAGAEAAMQPLAGAPLYAQPADIMSEVTDALNRYATSHLKRDLFAVSNDVEWLSAIACVSYKHANGFSKLVLGESESGRLRLHIWEPDAAAEENIHEHRWHFASAVIAGSIESEIWVDAFDCRAPTFEEFIYEVHSGGASRRSVGRTRAACLRKVTRLAGDAYFMLPGVMHRIARTSGVTATLVFTTAPSRSWNRMLADDGVKPNVDKQPLLPADVRRLIDVLAAQLTAEEARVRRP